MVKSDRGDRNNNIDNSMFYIRHVTGCVTLYPATKLPSVFLSYSRQYRPAQVIQRTSLPAPYARGSVPVTWGWYIILRAIRQPRCLFSFRDRGTGSSSQCEGLAIEPAVLRNFRITAGVTFCYLFQIEGYTFCDFFPTAHPVPMRIRG